MDEVLLLAPALLRVVPHGDDAACDARFEQLGRRLVGLRVLALRLRRLRRNDARQPVEELLHRRRKRRLELVERALQILEHRRAGEALEERAAEIERAQLGERQSASGDRAAGLRVHAPELRAVDRVVVDGEARRLQGGQVAADRARGDVQVLGQLRDGVRPRRRQLPKERPLADQLAVASHRDPPWRPCATRRENEGILSAKSAGWADQSCHSGAVS